MCVGGVELCVDLCAVWKMSQYASAEITVVGV